MKSLLIGPNSPDKPVPGWDTLDCYDQPGLTHRAVWGEEPLPIPDETYDLIYASHVLEHVPWDRVVPALCEACRILKTGGILEIWVPDFSKIVAAYLAGKEADNWAWGYSRNHVGWWVNGKVFAHDDPNVPDMRNWHRSLFDADLLRWALERVGFREIVILDQDKRRQRRQHRQNLGAEAVKPPRWRKPNRW